MCPLRMDRRWINSALRCSPSHSVDDSIVYWLSRGRKGYGRLLWVLTFQSQVGDLNARVVNPSLPSLNGVRISRSAPITSWRRQRASDVAGGKGCEEKKRKWCSIDLAFVGAAAAAAAALRQRSSSALWRTTRRIEWRHSNQPRRCVYVQFSVPNLSTDFQLIAM